MVDVHFRLNVEFNVALAIIIIRINVIHAFGVYDRYSINGYIKIKMHATRRFLISTTYMIFFRYKMNCVERFIKEAQYCDSSEQ